MKSVFFLCLLFPKSDDNHAMEAESMERRRKDPPPGIHLCLCRQLLVQREMAAPRASRRPDLQISGAPSSGTRCCTRPLERPLASSVSSHSLCKHQLKPAIPVNFTLLWPCLVTCEHCSSHPVIDTPPNHSTLGCCHHSSHDSKSTLKFTIRLKSLVSFSPECRL